MGRPRLNRVGEIHDTHHGKVKIIKYVDSGNMRIKFLRTGSVVKCSMGNLKKKHVYDPYSTAQHYNKGFFGVGPFSQTTHKNVYILWVFILQKAYCTKYKSKFKSYRDCRVVERWHNFQLFANDIVKMPNWNNSNFHLDKDLRKLGNKTYGPKFCSFVPSSVNKLLNMQMFRNKTTHLPMGVRNNKSKTAFEAQLSIDGVTTHIGTYDSIEEAQKAYAKKRCKYVHAIAEKFKNDIHLEVYDSLRSIKPTYFIRK